MSYIPDWMFDEVEHKLNPLASFQKAIEIFRNSGYTCPMDGFEWHLSRRMASYLLKNEPSFRGIGTIIMGIPVTKIEPLPNDALYRLELRTDYEE